MRVAFSQTRNFAVIAFTGWIYRIENLFTLPWKTECAAKLSTALNKYFLSFRIFQQLALALKNRVCPDFTVLNIYFLSFRILEKLALALKIFTVLEYFLSFRIFEHLALALKTEFALNSLYWTYIFYHSGFLSNLRVPWKTRVALKFFTVSKYFYHSGFFSNLRLPWKQRLPWNFSRQGGGRPPDPPPHTPMSVGIAETVNVSPRKLRSTYSSRQDHRTNAKADTAEAYFRRNVFYPFVDHITSEMERRFRNKTIPILLISCFMPSNIHKLNESVLESMEQCFDLPRKDWRSLDEFEHIDGWRRGWQQTVNSFQTWTSLRGKNSHNHTNQLMLLWTFSAMRPSNIGWGTPPHKTNSNGFTTYISRSLCERKQYYQAVWCIRHRKIVL